MFKNFDFFGKIHLYPLKGQKNMKAGLLAQIMAGSIN